MKRNRFSKTGGLKDSVTEQLKKDFAPIVKRTCNPVVRAMKHTPKTTFIVMMCILCVNMAAILIFSNHFTRKKKDTIWSFSIPKVNSSDAGNVSFSFSFKNFRNMEKLKDSLTYLLNKKQLSHGDTLLFIRLSEKLQQIDTGYHPIPIKP